MTDSEYAVAKAHVVKQGLTGLEACQACGKTGYTLGGPVVPPVAGLVVDGVYKFSERYQSVPLIYLACKQCHCIRFWFLWRPIEEEAAAR